ncbi:hypothetical protein QR685DRAFT_432122, partial [Neurospora intermedia]
NFYINVNEYEFYIKWVPFLECIVSPEGILLNLERVITIVKQEVPTSVYNF